MILLLYFAVGLGFYLGMSAKSLKTFSKAEVSEVLLGLALGFLLWPVGMVVAFKIGLDEMDEEDRLS